MKYLIKICFLIILFVYSKMSSQSNHFDNNCEDLLSDGLHTCRANKITKDCRSITLVEHFQNSINHDCLHIFNKDDLKYFLKNYNKFINIKALYISKVKIENFDFLMKLYKLERLTVNIDVITNPESFVRNMNLTNVHVLDLGKVNCENNFEIINNLFKVKTLRIYNSRIKNVNIILKLDQLVISDCTYLRKLSIPFIKNLDLENNELKKMPIGLSDAPNLLALTISQTRKMKVSCGINGFKKLIYLNLLNTPTIINRDCFLENSEVDILKFL